MAADAASYNVSRKTKQQGGDSGDSVQTSLDLVGSGNLPVVNNGCQANYLQCCINPRHEPALLTNPKFFSRADERLFSSLPSIPPKFRLLFVQDPRYRRTPHEQKEKLPTTWTRTTIDKVRWETLNSNPGAEGYIAPTQDGKVPIRTSTVPVDIDEWVCSKLFVLQAPTCLMHIWCWIIPVLRFRSRLSEFRTF